MAILPSVNNLRGVVQRVFFIPIVYGFISLLPMFLSGWENSDRLTDRLFSVIRSKENTFDFIIVGGGTAGALVANRLSEYYSVLLLEAGGTPSPFQTIPALSLKFLNHPQTDWSHKTVPQRKACLNSVNQQSSWSSGKGLGGTTNINFMLHTRGHPMDFEQWAEITGDPSWGYAGVLPYFKRTETFSGTSNDPEARGHDGELKIRKPSYIGLSEDWIRAGQELGYPFVDLNGRHEEGFGILQYPIFKGIRQTTYSAFLFPMHKSPRLTIRRFAVVRKILFRDTNNMAYGVEYVRHGKVETAISTKEVILSAGTLGSSKLLMLSGVGPKAHLEELGIPVRSDLPVGQNLQDHLGVHLGPFFIGEPKSFLFDRDVTPENIVRWLFLGTGPITTTGYQAAASIASSVAKANGEGTWPDLHLILHGQAIHKGYADAFAYAYSLQEDDLQQYYTNAFGKDSFHITVVGARPSTKGQVLLSGASITDPLVINPKYLEDHGERDYKVLLEGVKTALSIANTSVFQRFGTEFTTAKLSGCDEHYHGTDEYWECYIRRYTITMHNPVGTNAMEHVVDKSLRVKGTRGLRILDASVQPTIVSTGTAASTYMIAEKGVDMVLKDHGIPDRDTDLFDVVFGRNGFFKRNPILRILQREFDTLNPLRAIFKPFTSTKNKVLDAHARHTKNSALNNPILQVISSLLGNSHLKGDLTSASASESVDVNFNGDGVISATDPPTAEVQSQNQTQPAQPASSSLLEKRFGLLSDSDNAAAAGGQKDEKDKNILSKSQWVLDTSSSSRYTTSQPVPGQNYPSFRYTTPQPKSLFNFPTFHYKYSTPRPQSVHNFPFNKIVKLGVNEYKRLQIPENIATVKGKGGRRYALLQALLKEAQINATKNAYPPTTSGKSVVEVVKFQKHSNSENEIDYQKPDTKASHNNYTLSDVVAKPISVNPYSLGVLSVNTLPESSADQFKPKKNAKPSPFDDLLKHIKTFENFILSLTEKDKPRSWSSYSKFAKDKETSFTASPSQNPFHFGGNNNGNRKDNNIFSTLLSALSSNMNNASATIKSPINIGTGTAFGSNGSIINPFQFLFNSPVSTTETPVSNDPFDLQLHSLNNSNNKSNGTPIASVVGDVDAAKNNTIISKQIENNSVKSSDANIFSSWFKPSSPSASTSSWFKPFDTNPSPQSSSSSWFNPFNINGNNNDNSNKPNPLFKPFDVASFFRSTPDKSSPSSSASSQSSSSTSSPLASWLKPLNFDSDTRSAVAVTTPASLPPMSDPLADLFDLLFGGLKRHERKAIYQTLESMADAGQNIVEFLGPPPSKNDKNNSHKNKNFFEQIATGKPAEVEKPKTTADSYNDFVQSLVALNEFFNQYTSTTTATTSTSTTTTTTTTMKPHPLVAYLNTFTYPPSTTSPTPTPSSNAFSTSNSTILAVTEEIESSISTTIPNVIVTTEESKSINSTAES